MKSFYNTATKHPYSCYRCISLSLLIPISRYREALIAAGSSLPWLVILSHFDRFPCMCVSRIWYVAKLPPSLPVASPALPVRMTGWLTIEMSCGRRQRRLVTTVNCFTNIHSSWQGTTTSYKLVAGCGRHNKYKYICTYICGLLRPPWTIITANPARRHRFGFSIIILRHSQPAPDVVAPSDPLPFSLSGLGRHIHFVAANWLMPIRRHHLNMCRLLCVCMLSVRTTDPSIHPNNAIEKMWSIT